MASWTVGKLVGASVAMALFAACGSSGDGSNNFGTVIDSGVGTLDSGSPINGDDSGSANPDSGTGLGDDSSTPGDDGSTEGSTGGSCGSCTSDSDCQNSCPPVSGGGTNCCDTGSGVCYATTQNSCPSASDAGKE